MLTVSKRANPRLRERVGHAMIEPLISLQFLSSDGAYRSGDVLYAEYQIDAVESDDVQAVELSILWYTEGKGDEDLAVHFFERRVSADADDGDLRRLYRFKTELPNSPLTYSGEILRIRWCGRVRIFLRRGKELFFDQPFQLLPRQTNAEKQDDLA
jgi:hypothetical protein